MNETKLQSSIEGGSAEQELLDGVLEKDRLALKNGLGPIGVRVASFGAGYCRYGEYAKKMLDTLL